MFLIVLVFVSTFTLSLLLPNHLSFRSQNLDIHSFIHPSTNLLFCLFRILQPEIPSSVSNLPYALLGRQFARGHKNQ